MTIEIVYDATELIRASIEEVFKTIGEAAPSSIVVILLFLGSFRSVMMPIVTIPLSLVGVCFVLFALGYSINLLTLLAMVLAIGLVVDDAIVVVENIHRHIEEGLKPDGRRHRAACGDLRPDRRHDDDAGRRVRADRLHAGLTGALFREFAFTLAGAVVISGHHRRDHVADDVGAAAEAAWPAARASRASSTARFTRSGELVWRAGSPARWTTGR